MPPAIFGFGFVKQIRAHVRMGIAWWSRVRTQVVEKGAKLLRPLPRRIDKAPRSSERARRIAIVGNPWDSVVAQGNGSMVILAYQLARHLPSGWQVTLYGRRLSGQKRRESDGETIEIKRLRVIHRPHVLLEAILGILSCYMKRPISYPISYFYHLSFALRLAFSIRAAQCDIVIVNNFPQFAAIIKSFNPSATVCLSMHSEWVSHLGTAGTGRQLRKLDVIVGCSEYITERLRSRFPGIATRCHTVYDGVDVEDFRPVAGGAAEGDEAERLLYVGRLVPEKGLHVLVRAFKILAESHPSLRLDLVGVTNKSAYLYICPDLKDGPVADLVDSFFGGRLRSMVRKQLPRGWRSYLDHLVTLTGGDQRIVYHGAVSHRETIDFYRRANVLVFPSIWQEPSGFPTFEAQACATPVVATFSGGIPEYVDNGRTGILVARGDAQELARAIGRLLDDHELASAMGEAGRRRAVQHFSIEMMARRLVQLIECSSFASDPRAGEERTDLDAPHPADELYTVPRQDVEEQKFLN